MLIDTHCHLYDSDFDLDRREVVARARAVGVAKAILPGIDRSCHEALMRCVQEFPDFCLPAVGLHPTSVAANYQEELDFVEQQLAAQPFVAIGEIGVDGYWSREFMSQQKQAFETQLHGAAAHKLPVIIHHRDAFNELYDVLKACRQLNLKGVLHAYSGSYEQYVQLQKCGDFKIGIGGVLTFKNAGLAQVVQKVPTSALLLETDAPWLSPVPHRGKRNESSYLPLITSMLATLLALSVDEISHITSQNAKNLFIFED
jgi:hydrolase, TatD family